MSYVEDMVSDVLRRTTKSADTARGNLTARAATATRPKVMSTWVSGRELSASQPAEYFRRAATYDGEGMSEEAPPPSCDNYRFSFGRLSFRPESKQNSGSETMPLSACVRSEAAPPGTGSDNGTPSDRQCSKATDVKNNGNGGHYGEDYGLKISEPKISEAKGDEEEENRVQYSKNKTGTGETNTGITNTGITNTGITKAGITKAGGLFPECVSLEEELFPEGSLPPDGGLTPQVGLTPEGGLSPEGDSDKDLCVIDSELSRPTTPFRPTPVSVTSRPRTPSRTPSRTPLRTPAVETPNFSPPQEDLGRGPSRDDGRLEDPTTSPEEEAGLSSGEDHKKITARAVAAKKVTSRNRGRLASLWYDKFNEEVFDNRLPARLDILWNPRFTNSAGRTAFQVQTGKTVFADKGVSVVVTGKACDGPACDGPACDGPACNGPACNGPAGDGPVCDGPAGDGPACNGPEGAECVSRPPMADELDGELHTGADEDCLFNSNEALFPVKIELSTKLVTSVDRLQRTLLHEMCHVAQVCLDGKDRGKAHGPVFKKWVAVASRRYPSVPVSTQHSYTLEGPQHRWLCQHCRQPYQRKTKTINIKTQACSCGGALEYLGKFDSAGRKVSKKKCNAYQAFCKNNYNRLLTIYKDPKLTMKHLGTEWQQHKLSLASQGIDL
ncbi:SprT-like family protein [Gregarina niphandrodes]|uniref:SprT-like family protein n=1 Tax=Gregarina niphandrodes TaxID=110365 RepID=A0A023BAD7_GRENI|nr:SprT-like family protein [Gregarina niphandrodes]EZG78207.1 SprT-like family protein [Gregarina niphandrodes]|eukprot:XP_011129427.1 SprT-like family protein [Gregarina niphandrodes]